MEGTFNRVSSIFFLILRIGITVIMILAFLRKRKNYFI